MQLLLIGLIFFAAHVVSSVTGFGAAVVGIPVLAMLVGLIVAKQSMVVLGTLLYVHMTLRQRRQIHLPELRRILLLAFPGLIAGILACQFIPARAATVLLGLFVLGVAIRGLLTPTPAAAVPAAADPLPPNFAGRALLFLGGLVHGAFTTGGPLIVVYCRRALPDRHAFRATLGAMWLILGLAMMADWTIHHTWHAHTFRTVLLGLPFLAAGILGGEYLHHRVDARTFSAAVHLTLLVTGGVLCWSALR